jgi:hypothetical protein
MVPYYPVEELVMRSQNGQHPQASSDYDAFTQKLQGLEQRVRALNEQAYIHGGTGDLVAETLAELQVSLEELHVAQEELWVQSEELLLAHRAVEAEQKRYHALL